MHEHPFQEASTSLYICLNRAFAILDFFKILNSVFKTNKGLKYFILCVLN